MAGKRRKALRWIIPLALVAAVGYFALRPGAGALYAQATATTGDIRTTYSFTGNITAPRRQSISAPGEAIVKEVYVAANDVVKSGQRLIKLSDGALIKSDIAGEVVRLNVRKDDAVAPGSPLATIVDVGRLEVQISIDEYDVAAVAPGKAVEVTVNALGLTCPGVIQSFDKDASTDGTLAAYSAVVALDAPGGVLPGMQVEVKLPNQSAEGVTLLPAEALQFDAQNRAYVLKRSGNGYAETYVETGITDGASVQILSGVASGEAVYYKPSADDALMMMRMSRGARP